MHRLPTEFPDFGLTPEQRHEAVFGHYYEYPGMDGERGEIWCYTRPLLLPARRDGDAACQLDGPSFRLEIVRDGGTETPVLTIESQDRGALAGHAGPMLGRGLRLGGDVRVPRRRRLAVRRLSHHADGRGPRRQADLLRPSDHRRARRPAANPAASCRSRRPAPGLAYNTWGGSNHYQGITGPERDQYRHDRQHRAAAGAAASSCCRRMRRACRWRSRCRR